MTPLTARLRCLGGCPNHFPLASPIYRCPSCHGLLDVEHDLDALAKRSASEWKRLFDDRRASSNSLDASGVWSKREWVAPELAASAVVTLGEGATPLVHAERYGNSVGHAPIWIKMCGNSHTGSFKDLGMTVLVSVARASMNADANVRVLACASTGDTSAALAAYAAAAGLPVVVLLPKGKTSRAQLIQPLASGARVLALDTDFDGCMAIVDQLAQESVIYLANSMNALRLEGQKTVAIEIAQQLGWTVPDWVFLPSGNLGNAYALYLGFRMMKELGITDRMPRLCSAQAANANPLYLAWNDGRRAIVPQRARATQASAIQIGSPVSEARAFIALEAMDGLVEQATEDELCDAAARADRCGMFVCPHTAVALVAFEKLVKRGLVRKNERAVIVSTASALKFTEFKVQYHERAISGVGSTHANSPIDAPANVDRVRALIDEVRRAREITRA